MDMFTLKLSNSIIEMDVLIYMKPENNKMSFNLIDSVVPYDN